MENDRHADTGFAVWEHAHSGRRLHVFSDEFLAMQFAVSIGSTVQPYYVNF